MNVTLQVIFCIRWLKYSNIFSVIFSAEKAKMLLVVYSYEFLTQPPNLEFLKYKKRKAQRLCLDQLCLRSPRSRGIPYDFQWLLCRGKAKGNTRKKKKMYLISQEKISQNNTV